MAANPIQMLMQMMMQGGQMPPQMPMPKMTEQGMPNDPRFGPVDDPVRDETEAELATVRDTMGVDEHGWEGDETPTEADLAYVREHPTDGVIASFLEQFPKYSAEDVMAQGGNPNESPDQYAMDDESFQALQANRSTSIDDR